MWHSLNVCLFNVNVFVFSVCLLTRFLSVIGVFYVPRNGLTFIVPNKIALKVTLEERWPPANQHCQYGNKPWQKENRTAHVNWLSEASLFYGQQIDAWWIKTLVQTPAEHTICFSAIPLIRDTYFNLFLFPLSFHRQRYHP